MTYMDGQGDCRSAPTGLQRRSQPPLAAGPVTLPAPPETWESGCRRTSAHAWGESRRLIHSVYDLPVESGVAGRDGAGRCLKESALY